MAFDSSLPAPSSDRPPWWLALFALGAAVLALRTRWPATRAVAASSRAPTPIAVAQARAQETGRGREAASPLHMPWAAWKDILVRTGTAIGEDRVMAVAGGVVFYGLLAIFPALTALVSCYGLFADPQAISNHLSLAAGVMPDSAYQLFSSQLSRIVAKSDSQLSLTFIFGFAVALWSANAGTKAVVDALNVIYGEREERSFIRLTLVSLALTAGGLVMILVAVAAIVVLPLILSWIGFGGATDLIMSLVRWPALALLVALALAVLYRTAPDRRAPRWRWVSLGAAFATLAWLGGSALFSWYLANMADYNATYGSLGAVIGLMMWLWLSIVIVLVGAELDSEIEHQTAHDSTIGPDRPLGERGAVVADTVGEARR